MKASGRYAVAWRKRNVHPTNWRGARVGDEVGSYGFDPEDGLYIKEKWIVLETLMKVRTRKKDGAEYRVEYLHLRSSDGGGKEKTTRVVNVVVLDRKVIRDRHAKYCKKYGITYETSHGYVIEIGNTKETR